MVSRLGRTPLKHTTSWHTLRPVRRPYCSARVPSPPRSSFCELRAAVTNNEHRGLKRSSGRGLAQCIRSIYRLSSQYLVADVQIVWTPGARSNPSITHGGSPRAASETSSEEVSDTVSEVALQPILRVDIGAIPSANIELLSEHCRFSSSPCQSHCWNHRRSQTSMVILHTIALAIEAT